MPDQVFGIPTVYVFIGCALMMIWQSLWGKHNRFLARLSVIGLAFSILVPWYITANDSSFQNYPTLTTIGFYGLVTFLLASVAWLIMDIIPVFGKLTRRTRQ